MCIIVFPVINMAGYALKLESIAVNAIIIQHIFYRDADLFPRNCSRPPYTTKQNNSLSKRVVFLSTLR